MTEPLPPTANPPVAPPPTTAPQPPQAQQSQQPQAQQPRPPHAQQRQPQEAAAPLVVSLQEVSRRFGDVVAVDHVTIGVPQGAIVGVIGPSGAGKTTTIRLMTGSLEPD